MANYAWDQTNPTLWWGLWFVLQSRNRINYMILSDIDVRKFIESGDIGIDPFDEKLVKPAGYVLTLNKKLWIPKLADEIDSRSTKPEYDIIEMNESGYVIQPGDFLLGQTKEKISVSQKLCGIHDARSSLARIGLNVLQGSVLVQPGQRDSHETLEINNISKSPIRIYPGMMIVKMIFVLLNTPSEKNYSQSGEYKNQSEPNPILHR